MSINLAQVKAAIRAESYFAIASDRRFRAVERRELRNAARTGMLLVLMLIAVFGVPTLLLVRPHDAGLTIAVEGGLGLIAGAGYVVLGRWLRHYPEPVVFAFSLAVILACVAIGAGTPELAIISSGYLLLLPPVVSQLVTWRTWTHTLWLFVYVVAVFGFLAVVPISGLAQPEKVEVAVLALVSFVASFVGHVLTFRSRIRSFGQLRTIEVLHRDIERERSALAQAVAELERTSRVDPLTRIANRLRLDEDFEEIRARINRTGETCGLLEADLDRFKLVNDRLGHLAGDAVLRAVAQALQGELRAGDHVYRYGGEEFVAIIADADRHATQAAAERLRAAVEALRIPHPGNQPSDIVTISVGATVIGAADIDETDDALFDRADRAMYRVKTNGRNQVALDLPLWLDTRSGIVPVAAGETG